MKGAFLGPIPPAPDRQVLPNRRPSEVLDIETGYQRFQLEVGYDPDHKPAEVFISGLGTGSELANLAQDAAVLISLCLQHGIPPARLARSFARVPEAPTDTADLGSVGKPATLIGVVLDRLAALADEIEHSNAAASAPDASGYCSHNLQWACCPFGC
ncbi:MAG TPA: hypothetical protein VGU69_10645 [Rhizomicrobium sp.]|nr:hypothetical protein [Rhizomicrobium sp.]